MNLIGLSLGVFSWRVPPGCASAHKKREDYQRTRECELAHAHISLAQGQTHEIVQERERARERTYAYARARKSTQLKRACARDCALAGAHKLARTRAHMHAHAHARVYAHARARAIAGIPARPPFRPPARPPARIDTHRVVLAHKRSLTCKRKSTRTGMYARVHACTHARTLGIARTH